MNMAMSQFPGRRLRIAHVTLGLDMGGQEKLLVEFAQHVDRKCFALEFLSLGSRGTLAEEIEAHSWPVTALNEPTGLRPGLVLRLARFLRRRKIDVVHTHDVRPLIYGAVAARLARVPSVVHTRHGQDSRITPRQRALVRFAARLTDRFVCVSEDSARLTIEQGVAAAKVRAIINGIDVEQFAYTGPQPRGPVVTIARLSPEKDIANLIRTAAIVAGAEPGFRLEIAGDGPCRVDLEALIDGLGLKDRVRLLGQVRDVRSLLGRASLFVLPSVSEGVSLTLLEAMARGLAVVATRVGGNPEVVVDGDTGQLVPARNPDALADAMLALLRDPERSRRMGLAGRRRVEQVFDVRRMVADYEELYRELAGRRLSAGRESNFHERDDRGLGYFVPANLRQAAADRQPHVAVGEPAPAHVYRPGQGS
jgi:glycosyltransferase involved in cell wall biosynthesis